MFCVSLDWFIRVIVMIERACAARKRREERSWAAGSCVGVMMSMLRVVLLFRVAIPTIDHSLKLVTSTVHDWRQAGMGNRDALR